MGIAFDVIFIMELSVIYANTLNHPKVLVNIQLFHIMKIITIKTFFSQFFQANNTTDVTVMTRHCKIPFYFF